MGSDPPCKGDAYQPIAVLIAGLGRTTCDYCIKSVTNGGKCAGEDPFTFMLNCIASGAWRDRP